MTKRRRGYPSETRVKRAIEWSTATRSSFEALWFTNASSNAIDRTTTAGVIATLAGDGILDPRGITVGSDGALWFTISGIEGSIGRIATNGVVSIYTDPKTAYSPNITAGSDGALWFTPTARGLAGISRRGDGPVVCLGVAPNAGWEGRTSVNA